MTDGASRFLIVRLGSLGDIIHAIPAVAALKRRYPRSVIHWIVDPRYVELVKLVSVVDVVTPVDPRHLWSTLASLRRLSRDVAYDAVVDLQGLIKSAVIARVIGARRRIGFSQVHLREPLARWLYGEAVDPGPELHVIRKGIGLMRTLGVEEVAIEFPLTMPTSPAAAAVALRAGSEGYMLINPGAAWPNKRWPPERFGALAAAVRERYGVRSVVLWGPGEETAAAIVVAASGGSAEAAPATTITDIIVIAKGARLMVSGDTGPLHIAGAVGTPIVALFGPTRVERNGPWASSDISITRYDQCVCHYERQCRRGQPCINDISVDEVVSAVERRIAVQ